jgi:hypothetical protein
MRLVTRLTSYAISDEQRARKKRSGQPAMNRSKQGRMARKTIVVLLFSLALVSVHLVDAQQPTKVPRIGRPPPAPGGLRILAEESPGVDRVLLDLH